MRIAMVLGLAAAASVGGPAVLGVLDQGGGGSPAQWYEQATGGDTDDGTPANPAEQAETKCAADESAPETTRGAAQSGWNQVGTAPRWHQSNEAGADWIARTDCGDVSAAATASGWLSRARETLQPEEIGQRARELGSQLGDKVDDAFGRR